MARQLDIPDMLLTRGVDETQCTSTVPDIQRVRRRIVAQVVGITRKLDTVTVLERGAIKHLAHACFRIGHEDGIRLWYEQDPLRLVESSDGVQMCPCLQIKDLQRIVA
jgi:hypothetical protein